jgi:hypothetical protein
VSARASEEVSEYERSYEDGSDPKVLDVINVTFLGAKPKTYQQENWLLDPEYYWVRSGVVNWSALPGFAETPATLWINGISTYNGINDEIPLATANTLVRSLYFLRIEAHQETEWVNPMGNAA